MRLHAATAAAIGLSGAAMGQNGDGQGGYDPNGAGQDVVAALFWNDFMSSGPSATNQEDDAFDLWVLEDFSIETDVTLSAFESEGWVTSGNVGGITDVTVRIYDALPWEGGSVLVESIEGAGHMEDTGAWGRYFSEFAGETLDAGAYVLAWQASRANPGVGIALFFAAPGEHDIGGGEPDDAFQWNPGGGFGWENNFQQVPADLDGNGTIGVNFTLIGEEAGCLGDYNGDGALNVLDFVAFQQGWQAQEAQADCNGDGAYNVLDFVCFQEAFAAGCG